MGLVFDLVVQRLGVKALLILGCALAGCHSTQFGTILGEPGPVRARLGEPFLEEDRPPLAPDQRVIPPSAALSIAEGQVIDLPGALRIAGAESPIIALAEEAARLRLAEQSQARAMLLPTLDAGANLRMHRGVFLTGRGVVVESNLQSLYYGFGADTKGGGTVAVPGIRLIGHLADAIYAPRAAERRVTQGHLAAIATRNRVLADVGRAYLDLAGAQARLSAQQQTLLELGELARLTTNQARDKQGRESEARRAESEQLLAEAEAHRRREEIDVAAAQLARLLDMDPTSNLRAADALPPLIELVDAEVPLQTLIDQALARHPQIAAQRAEVEVQEMRVQQERVRPWLPVIALGFSAGEFGGGNDTGPTRLGNFSSRTDLDVLAVWSLQNMGIGNRSVQNLTRTQWDLAESQRLRAIDRVRQQVAEAHSLVRTRRQEIGLAQVRVETSERAYRQEIARARNLLARPIEVLATVNQLAAARQDLVRAMTSYGQAQLQLHEALGHEPRDLP